MKFSRFISESVNGKIILLVASSKSAALLRGYAEHHGFDISMGFDGEKKDPVDYLFHTTIVASKNDVEMKNTQATIQEIKTKAKGLKLLGVDKNIPVLELELTRELKALRTLYVDHKGLDPTFAEFIPHVTLSYNWNGDPDINKLKVPSFDITFDQISIDDFKGK